MRYLYELIEVGKDRSIALGALLVKYNNDRKSNTVMNVQHIKYDRQIAIWLVVCAAVIFGMIILGGVTRLTHSGLSMVEWKPLVGIIPPLSSLEWQETFYKYQQFPEYQKVNMGMSLSEFKSIFLFEYAHRVLGRLIGVIFLIPFLFFWLSGRIKAGLSPKLMIMFVLGGLQGLLGWYMVKSGLVDDPNVSQYRLTAHLGAAVIIYGFILWVAFDLIFSVPEKGSTGSSLFTYARAITGLLFLMILSGGLVAGTRAGLAYNTFPLMGDSFIPGGLYSSSPFWMAAFNDITTIQFNHRIFAYLLCALISGFVFSALRQPLSDRARFGVYALLFMLLVQVTLGISTLLLLVPVSIAAAHQGGAVLLFTCSLFVTHAYKR